MSGADASGWKVLCECAACLDITEGDVGRRLVCQCGRTVVVPTADEFRVRPVLKSATTIEARLARMVADGELPARSECLCCREANLRKVVDVELECERVRTQDDGAVWFLILPFALLMSLHLFAKAAFVASRDRDQVETFGRDRSVWLPVCVCRDCHDRLNCSPGRSYNVAALALFVLGLPAVYFLPFVGVGIMVSAIALAVWNKRRLSNKRQGALKTVLQTVPIYGQLLKKYPHAIVLWPEYTATGSDEL